jgi:hypothetical protein
MFRKVRWLLGLLVCVFLVSSAITQSVSVSLAWNASTDNVGVAGYHVYRNEVLIGTSSTTSFTDTTASPSTQYSYTVRAFDAAGNESGDSLPAVILTGTIITLGGGNDNTFTPLHTYFMSTTGNDANNGLTPATAWATPNHAVVCGDVILAAPGFYTNNVAISNGYAFFKNQPTPSNCPSTTGGIDGNGGIYFAIILCTGDLSGSSSTSCLVDGVGNVAGFFSAEFDSGQSNWAMEGFYFNSGCVSIATPGSCSRAFGPRTVSTDCGTGFKNHHLALINSVVTNSMQGWGFNDCGAFTGVANGFADYVAAVGVIVQNANRNGDFQAGICVGAIDFVGLGNWDTAAGTHAFQYTNYGINNQVAGCSASGGSNFDGEAFYIDSPFVHLFSQQAVISNNLAYLSNRFCIALTLTSGAPVGTFKIYNNTCFNNSANTGSDATDGEISTNTGGDLGTGVVTLTNNIAYIDHATSASGTSLYAVNSYASLANLTMGATSGNGQENVFKGQLTSCVNGGSLDGGPWCDAGFNVLFNDNGPVTGANFFENPLFANTTDLLANHTGAPNCAGFENTTQCMGWDARNNSMHTPSVISDLQAGCAHCGGKGFQLPSINCTPNPDYPAWLKGLNYLHALDGFTAGSRLVEKMGLTTKPCNM